jgi:hypothetical protein
VSFAAITLYVASRRVFIFVSVYFVIDSVRKLLDPPSYLDSAYFSAYPEQLEFLSVKDLFRLEISPYYICLREQSLRLGDVPIL